MTHVDDAGIHLSADVDGPIDVRFGENRVWSFTTVHDGTRRGTAVQVAWPPALRERLVGVAEVSVAPHAGGDPLFAGSVRFADSDEPLALVDDLGHPLSLDKGNRLQRTFDRMDDSSRRELIEAAKRVLDDLVEKCGLQAYLAYGCLLGAVRDGKMIGHDSDADLAWLSAYDHPFDIIRESRAAEQTMRDLGWQVLRMSAANFKVWVPLPSGKRAGIDVFGSFYVGDSFHITGSLRGPLDRDALLPFGTVTLEGVEFPAPHDLEKFLAFTYGPSWRVPDPAFHFGHPTANIRRMGAWLRGSRTRLHHWQEFYTSRAADQLPSGPSPFAAWVADRIEPGAKIVELGAGTGRDAFWLADQGYVVRATDYCGAAIKRMRDTNGRRVAGGSPYVRVRPLNLENDHNLLTRAAFLAHEPGPIHVYARLLVDAMTEEARPKLWRFCSMVGRSGGHTFVEFRTRDNPGGHDPRFADPNAASLTVADPDRVIAKIEAAGGRVVERVVGRGLAPLGDRDPVVCRLEIAWNTPRKEPG